MIHEGNSYYTFNKKLLSFIGHWPSQNRFLKRFIWFIYYCTVCSYLVPQYFGLQKIWGDIDAMIDSIPPIVITFASIAITTNFIYNEKKIELIISKINYDWKMITTKKELQILEDYTKTGRFMVKLYIYFAFSTMFLYLLIPLVPQLLDVIAPLNHTRPKRILYYLEYNIDKEKYFFWIVLHTYWSACLFGFVVVCADAMFMIIMQHACGIFAIIGYRLSNLVNLNNEYSNQELIKKEIIYCTEKHKKAMIFVSDVENLLSTAFFLVLGMDLILMSVTEVQVVVKIDQPKEAWRFAMYTITQIFHILYLTVPCEQLIDLSININNCIYNGSWYQLSIKTQRMLLIIMRKGSEPCLFVSGKVYTYSMQNFTAVLRTSISYFTLIRSIR